MRRLPRLAVLVALAALPLFATCQTACGCTPLPIDAWEAQLIGANELPTAVNTPGTATARFALTRGGDSITTNITIGIGLDSIVTEAHLHAGAPNATGAVAIWLCESAANQAPAGDPAPTCASGLVNGQVLLSGKRSITAAQLNTLRAFGFYANVHTLKYPDGEVRGQVRYTGF